MAKHGKFQGRSQSDLADAIKQTMKRKSASVSGTVTTLCVSPENGWRIVRDEVEVKQSIVGDCQNKLGWQSPDAAKIKNSGALLGDENIFVESLLSAVSIGDEDIVREVMVGVSAPRVKEVWATGDNLYISGIDMSWNNFRIGDLLVFPSIVIINTGYPHWACWKYAVRAGEDPKDYINSKEGSVLRMRGIKGAVLLPSPSSSSGSVKNNDRVRIVHKGSDEYLRIIQDCRAPLSEGTELFFQGMRAMSSDTLAYVNLLVFAGSESGRIDTKRYGRNLSAVANRQYDPSAMEISDAAMSGDGTLENVGIKINGQFQCRECRQNFDSDRARTTHRNFIHDPNRHQED
eukprot:TRINITY_DN49966_c0_g1_i1.p1 TRINITY_DN49966_c0_g1~~TRINITY_DN49966_c0_g1_i1.p1  ORF type:complete len:380 (+),score=45.94 TRINITY_DN49966_c0_g1_i1:104-1141(+)